jgi:hypothetical protein
VGFDLRADIDPEEAIGPDQRPFAAPADHAVQAVANHFAAVDLVVHAGADGAGANRQRRLQTGPKGEFVHQFHSASPSPVLWSH